MTAITSKEGVRKLRSAWILLATCLALAAVLVVGTHVYLKKEEGEETGSKRRLQEARSRLDNIRRERDSLEESAAIYRTLIARGLMQPERRLEMVELVNNLRTQHHIFSVDYDVSPQRPLSLAGGRTFPAVDILSSRVTLKVRALHEGDVLDFIQDLADGKRGFHPVDRCLFKRVDGPAGNLVQPRVEAECSLEWITMKDKRGA